MARSGKGTEREKKEKIKVASTVYFEIEYSVIMPSRITQTSNGMKKT